MESINLEGRAGSGEAGDQKNIDFQSKSFWKVSIFGLPDTAQYAQWWAKHPRQLSSLETFVLGRFSSGGHREEQSALRRSMTHAFLSLSIMDLEEIEN